MQDTVAEKNNGGTASRRYQGQYRERIPTAKFWPSGDCSLGWAPPPPPPEDPNAPKPNEDGYQTDLAQAHADQDQWIEALGLYAFHLQAQGLQDKATQIYEYLCRELRCPTGLSGALNSHKLPETVSLIDSQPERARRGSNGITPHGKKSLKSAAAIIEKRWARQLLSFTTLTIPGVDSDQLNEICEQWPEITRQFQQELSRELKRHRLPLDYFGCSEVQPKRWEKRREIAPHLHFCFVGRRSRAQKWLIDCHWIEATWKRVLLAVTGLDLDCSAATETRGVRKSVGNEVGKYLSKGGKVIREIREAGMGSALPSAYWNMPNALRREIRRLSRDYRGDMARLLHDSWRELNESGLFNLREVMVNIETPGTGPPKQFLAGLTGWFVGDYLQQIEKGTFEQIFEIAQVIGGQ